MINRRTFNKSLLLSALAAPAFVGRAAAADDEVVMGAILDLSGGLDIYGTPMLQMMQMAVDEINDAGGLIGKKVRLIKYDTQSNMQLYSQYAQQAALQDKVQFVHGGITSASREIIRPILGRYKTLYLYSTPHEGGVCDKNTFITGTSAAMTVKEPLKWAVNKWGKKAFLIGADYNYPRIYADWQIKFGKEYGATILGNEFAPLSVTEFGPLITRIQTEKPDFVSSALVGAAHMGFYRQWAAAGMLGKIPILSGSFGAGNEQKMLPADASNGIVAPRAYFMELDTPANKDFTARYYKKFGDKAPYVSDLILGGYEGTMLWAEAVKKAGTLDRDAMVAAMEGATYAGPAGTVKMNAHVHYAARDIYLGECQNQTFSVLETWKQQEATDAGDRCDLIKDPTTNQEFTPE
ncbi:ABC transporter substrate-binding protein [Mesorhizobium sp. CO1-1-8]|uniref:ABC transporter substrate-binding protein n=1 Tax=Mesorhizobium sp. CO1-1-8 TaxID=2876631 RepID=UPI001CD0851E|nr:ABC transporter substrate-binding protein [Mesorhizobium sp. CO1-1-8]MBZ9772550.1 transporter substrate-binding protein [Mesorhizobium sp. CO1-1-8]